MIVTALLVASCGNAPLPDRAPTVIYEGGLVWTGEGFEQKDIAVREGVFIETRRAPRGAETVSMAGRFLVPPYGNAHHHVANPTDQSSWTFMKEGVFYVWNPNLYSAGWSEETRAYYARKDTYDVRTSMGGLTEPGGHPEKLYVEILSQYVYQGDTLEDFLGKAFHYARSQEEIDETLDLLEAQGASFVKIYVLYSEEYEALREDEAAYGAKGLNPENLTYIVDEAHKRGLPVAAHVQTRNDLLVSVKAGVDMLAHAPSYSTERRPEDFESVRITAEDAALVAARGTTVVPTYVLSKNVYSRNAIEGTLDEDLRDLHYSIQADNLRLLHEAGAVILTGTDSDYGVVREAAHWVDIGAMPIPAAVGSVLSTASYLYPDRKIGEFRPGYEADFLVLDENPLEDIGHLNSISVRVKAGNIITAPINDEE
ncbi:MAG: amidohydrolase family protein [Pseudomonadota bacterium]